MSGEDWHKILVQRSNEEYGKAAPTNDPALNILKPEQEKVTDAQLERAVDVLKGILLFNSANNSAKP